MSFFKKVEPDSLFLEDRPVRKPLFQFRQKAESDKRESSSEDGGAVLEDVQERFHEEGGSCKRRKLSGPMHDEQETVNAAENGCSPPPPVIVDGKEGDGEGRATGVLQASAAPSKKPRHVGPFLEESDSEDEAIFPQKVSKPMQEEEHNAEEVREPKAFPNEVEAPVLIKEEEVEDENSIPISNELPPSLKREATSYAGEDGFADFEGMEDFEDEYVEGEEFVERKWMREQRRLEMENDGFEGELEDVDRIEDGDEDGADFKEEAEDHDDITEPSIASCPICAAGFEGISDQEASVHVNNCLDGNPTPLPAPKPSTKPSPTIKPEPQPPSAKFRRPFRPAKPGQESPFTLGSANGTSSAFSKLMSGHAEDAAWATAAAAEHASRGKPAFQRTCPFYKILPGFFICVDAFRYGAVQGCNAYFLSHFHSDHYIGLTSTWSHGPIYCSRATANLVKQQLRVDPKWVVELEFEKKVEVPGTQNVFVTMIPANHCPGSSLYLFEKVVGKGKNPKVQRVLHCGDFRACPAHVEHPLLKPDVIDLITGKTVQQKIDVCYLDTTYLNPKYAFPSQEDVIQACADMCVSLNKVKPDSDDKYEQMKKERAGTAMAKFVRTDSKDDTQSNQPTDKPSTTRGPLLVVVGTYSIGKERICLGIARALNSKIYAPPGKQRICACLEDPELNARLTSDPRAAQVHMTPLFEIRAETLGDYLAEYRDSFSRCVGFRPSGWNYRPPGSRFVESPAVGTVLYSDNWKSGYSMRELVPQRGSTSRAACYGVPYSEHSSFRELTMFCCALRIEKVVPTVNVGSGKGREKMRQWCERWAVERKKNGLFRVWEKGEGGGGGGGKDDGGDGGKDGNGSGSRGKNNWYPGKGTWELRTTL